MEIRRVRRKIDGDFDEKVFYRFYNSVRPNTTISAGQNQDSGGAINMTVAETYSSSENWQIYYQQGRYFIRNYDYGDYQLGVTESSRSVPRLLKRSGALGQQWSLMRDDAGGGWKMSNGLLGNGTWLSISGINTVPAMQPSGNGAVWDIQTNPSAGSPKGGDLYQDVDNFEVAPSSSSATSSATATSTSLSTAQATASTTAIPSPSSVATNGGNSPLSTGAIVGIAVGGFAFVVIAAILVWFLIAKRKKKNDVPELPGDQKWVYARRVEMGGEPVVHVAQEKNYVEPRFEMG